MTGGRQGVSLTRVTGVLLACRMLGFVLLLGNSIILARVLGVEALGQYAYAMGLTAMFGLLPNLGISTVVTRAIALDPWGSLNTLRAALHAQRWLAILVFVAVISFAAVLPQQPVPFAYVALAAAQLALGTLSWPYLAVLGGRARYDRLAVAEVVVGLMSTSLMIGAALWRPSVEGFLWTQVIASGASIVVARVIAAPLLPETARESLTIRALFRQAIPFGIAALVQGFYTRVDIMLLGQLASPVSVGLYSAAYKPINMVVNFGSAAAGTLFPFVVQESRAGPSGSVDRVMRVFLVTAPALALGLTGCARLLLSLLYGSDFRAAASILAILAWSAAVNWLYTPLSIVLQAKGQEHRWARVLALGFAVNVILNLSMIPRWDGAGAAAATLVSELMVLATAAFLVSRDVGIALPRITVVSVGGAVLVAGMLLYLLWPVGALPATATSLAAYGAALFFLRVASTDDVLKLLGRFREAVHGQARA